MQIIFLKNKEKELRLEIEKYLKEKNRFNLILNKNTSATRCRTSSCIWKGNGQTK